MGINLERGEGVGVLFAQIIEGLFGPDRPSESEFSKDGEDVDINEIVIEIGEAFRSMSQDQMGMGTIVYFPTVPFVDAGESDDEEVD